MTLTQLAEHYEASVARWLDHAAETSSAATRRSDLARAETFAYCARELRKVIGGN